MIRVNISSKLILVEGIPGSGKTTLTQKMNAWYGSRNIPARLYNEGIANPVDLAWCAYIPIDKYHELLEKYSSISDKIKERTVFEGEHAIVEYTQVQGGTSFHDEFQNYEVYGGRVSDAEYFDTTTRRWRAFGNSNPNEISIIESAFLQNTVMELMFYRQIDDAEIIPHTKSLINYVKKFSPILIYLSQPDIRKTIQHIADERVDWGWIELMIANCEKAPYAKQHKIKGFDGVVEMLEKRKQLEKTIISQLPIKSVIIENTDNNWDDVWKSIEQIIDQ